MPEDCKTREFDLTKPVGQFQAELAKDDPGVEVWRLVDPHWLSIKVTGGHPEFGVRLSLDQALSVARSIINNVLIQRERQQKDQR